MLPSKGLSMDDYADLQPALRALNPTVSWARGKGHPISMAHPHRAWEYCSAIIALREVFKDTSTCRVVDIGCGMGALGPTLARVDRCAVLDIDPLEHIAPLRQALAEDMTKQNALYAYIEQGLEDVEGTFDGVFSISVMEHIPADDQERAWRRLASLVAPGGVLATTIDYGWEGAWKFDDIRGVKPGAEYVERVCGWLRDEGIQTSMLDLTNYGPQVFEYTFFRILGQRVVA